MTFVESSAAATGQSMPAPGGPVRIRRMPDWAAAECLTPESVRACGPEPWLIFAQSFHAELNHLFVHHARRLDSPKAVQEVSPWTLAFDPVHEQVVLHWIKTWRGGEPVQIADLSAVRVVDQSPVGAEPRRLVAALMLDDVRVGDILEWCYTIERRPAVLPDRRAVLFTLPPATPVGWLRFSARFNADRPMRWKSSESGWAPADVAAGAETVWDWSRTNYPGHVVEPNAPSSWTPYPWIHLSDHDGWGPVAGAFAQAWETAPETEALEAFTAAIPAGLAPEARAEHAVRLVRDEIRHLPGEGALDAAPPTAPGVTLRRRYGTPKDTAVLLAALLRRLGVEAAPVLSSAAHDCALNQFLPDPALLDHVVVQYAAGGAVRWVDPARRGEAPATGLPLTGADADLVLAPAGQNGGGLCELRESILLDTTGAPSWLGVVVAARGAEAEALRRELDKSGPEAFAAGRLRRCAARFGQAKRIGALQHRDNPAANEFFIAEIFEITGLVTLDPKTRWYKLDLANALIADKLAEPGPGPRRTPFALPFPCQFTHTIELYSPALAPMPRQQKTVQTESLRFVRSRRTHAGNWVLQLALSTTAPAVEPESLERHRAALREIREHSNWVLLLPGGEARPHQRRDFAVLPAAWNPGLAGPPPAAMPAPAAAVPEAAPVVKPPLPAPVPVPAPAPAPVRVAPAPAPAAPRPAPLRVPVVAATPVKLKETVPTPVAQALVAPVPAPVPAAPPPPAPPEAEEPLVFKEAVPVDEPAWEPGAPPVVAQSGETPADELPLWPATAAAPAAATPVYNFPAPPGPAAAPAMPVKPEPRPVPARPAPAVAGVKIVARPAPPAPAKAAPKLEPEPEPAAASEWPTADDPAALVAEAVAPTVVKSTAEQSFGPGRLRHRRIRRLEDRSLESQKNWAVVLGCLAALTLIVIVFVAAKNADAFHIFGFHPAPARDAVPTDPDVR